MFKKIILPLLLLNSILSAAPSHDKMSHELKNIEYNISMNYAPLEWKKEHKNWDLAQSIQNATENLKRHNNVTSENFHVEVKKLLSSMHDYHVSPNFYRLDLSFFPLLVKEAEGKVIIVKKGFNNILQGDDAAYINEDILTKWTHEANFNPDINKINLGSEILAINNVNIQDHINQIIQDEFSGDDSATAHSLAVSMIFKKIGELGNKTEEGSFKLKLLDVDNKIKEYTLPWFYVSEPLLKREMSKDVEEKIHKTDSEKSLVKNIKKKFRKNYTAIAAKKFVRAYTSSEEDESSDSSSETTKKKKNKVIKGFLPELGEVVYKYKGKSSLYAYIYTLNNGSKVGYIHLPTFDYDDDNEEEQIIDDIFDVLLKFKKHTNALVFDITNNPGGYSDFMNTVISMLSNKKVIPLLEKEIINPSTIYEALESKQELENELPIVKDKDEKREIVDLLSYFNILIQAFESNKHMTDLIFNNGEEYIAPDSQIKFNKPILVLTNELDFSCGDYFPAMIQDNKIGSLFGKKTAGAGGAVFEYEVPSNYGLKGYTLTGSLGFRQNGMPLENLGVVPDYPYELTVKDLKNNYCDYINAVNATVESMIKNHKKKK